MNEACTKFTLNEPYPPLTGVSRNIPAGRQVLFDYAGPDSEMSGIVQYAYYENFFDAAGNKALADLYACVSLTEMEHLHLLGQLIRALGVDPQYFVYLPGGRRRYWTAGSVRLYQTPVQILKTTIAGEKAGEAAYKKHAALLTGSARELLLRIAEDEAYHAHLFEQALENLTNTPQPRIYNAAYPAE